MRAFAAPVCFLALWSSALATTRDDQLVREWGAKTVREAGASGSRYFSPPSAILIPWLAREESHEKAGQLQDAISDYKEAIRLDPHSVLCWVGLARLFEETKQSDKAIAAYSSVLKFEPSNLPARFLRGQLSGRLGARDKAMADATEVIRQYPNRAEGYSLRAGLYNVKNDYQKAIADANRAIQVDPRNISACTDAYFALGFAENGDFGNAVQWEKRCLEGKDLSDAERGRVNERLALYRAGKPCREEPK